jgi:ribosomal protein S19
MTQRLKRWESPRRQGRNDRGKGGSARARQLKKQTQMLRKKLKEGQKADDQNQQQNKQKGREISSLPFFIGLLRVHTGHELLFWIQIHCQTS